MLLAGRVACLLWLPCLLGPSARAEPGGAIPALDATLRDLATALRDCDAAALARHVRFPLVYTEADTAKWTGSYDRYERIPAIRFRDARELAEACRARAERMPRHADIEGATSAQLSFDGPQATLRAQERLLTFAEARGAWRLVEVWSAGVSTQTGLRDDPSYEVRPGWPPGAPQDLGVPPSQLDQLPVALDRLMRALDRCDARELGATVHFPLIVASGVGDSDPEVGPPDPKRPYARYQNAASLARACLLRVELRPSVGPFPGDVFGTAVRVGEDIELSVPRDGYDTDGWRMRYTQGAWRLTRVLRTP